MNTESGFYRHKDPLQNQRHPQIYRQAYERSMMSFSVPSFYTNCSCGKCYRCQVKQSAVEQYQRALQHQAAFLYPQPDRSLMPLSYNTASAPQNKVVDQKVSPIAPVKQEAPALIGLLESLQQTAESEFQGQDNRFTIKFELKDLLVQLDDCSMNTRGGDVHRVLVELSKKKFLHRRQKAGTWVNKLELAYSKFISQAKQLAAAMSDRRRRTMELPQADKEVNKYSANGVRQNQSLEIEIIHQKLETCKGCQFHKSLKQDRSSEYPCKKPNGQTAWPAKLTEYTNKRANQSEAPSLAWHSAAYLQCIKDIRLFTRIGDIDSTTIQESINLVAVITAMFKVTKKDVQYIHCQLRDESGTAVALLFPATILKKGCVLQFYNLRVRLNKKDRLFIYETRETTIRESGKKLGRLSTDWNISRIDPKSL